MFITEYGTCNILNQTGRVRLCKLRRSQVVQAGIALRVYIGTLAGGAGVLKQWKCRWDLRHVGAYMDHMKTLKLTCLKNTVHGKQYT